MDLDLSENPPRHTDSSRPSMRVIRIIKIYKICPPRVLAQNHPSSPKTAGDSCQILPSQLSSTRSSMSVSCQPLLHSAAPECPTYSPTRDGPIRTFPSPFPLCSSSTHNIPTESPRNLGTPGWHPLMEWCSSAQWPHTPRVPGNGRSIKDPFHLFLPLPVC